MASLARPEPLAIMHMYPCLANYSEERAEKLKMIKEVVDEMTVKEQHETVQEYFPNADDGGGGERSATWWLA
jgi:hypothetical protein